MTVLNAATYTHSPPSAPNCTWALSVSMQAEWLFLTVKPGSFAGLGVSARCDMGVGMGSREE